MFGTLPLVLCAAAAAAETMPADDDMTGTGDPYDPEGPITSSDCGPVFVASARQSIPGVLLHVSRTLLPAVCAGADHPQ